MDNTGPIGVFDSGVGGLSVMRHIRKLLPNEHLVYIADTAHAPYGNKSAAEIVRRSFVLSQFLVEIGAKALVVACNTATAVAVTRLRSRFDLPIIGMEPALKPAAVHTNSGVVGILATLGTLNSQKFCHLNAQFGKDAQIITQVCPGLVEQVEAGDIDSNTTRALVRDYVSKLLQRGADTIVLGCTHYPILKPLIQEVAGPDIKIIDSGDAVARQLARRLADSRLLSENQGQGSTKFWSSNATEHVQRSIRQILQSDVVVSSLPPNIDV